MSLRGTLSWVVSLAAAALAVSLILRGQWGLGVILLLVTALRATLMLRGSGIAKPQAEIRLNLDQPSGSLSRTLPEPLKAQLNAIEPSQDGDFSYYPCRVTLKDGTTLDRVYFASEAYIRSRRPDRGDEIDIADVATVEESPTRTWNETGTIWWCVYSE